ncbi:2-dehydro-3-deoxygalactonokinase [Pararobbsia alpina]|uniref:2-dehydro-3-deoxygalactonokinase n=1 Tax=Pararobbsia alpina TaxID=621374 RepID=UPI0039A63C7B
MSEAVSSVSRPDEPGAAHDTPADLSQAVLVALDWGTSSLRAYLFAAQGKVIAVRNLPWGVMKLPRPAAEGGFDEAFEAACGDWLDARPGLPLIACGMVGSAQGWVEATYIDTPADANRLASSLAEVRTQRGVTLRIVPGVLERGALPNVMRGEETQILGAMLGDRAAGQGDASRKTLVGLPGSHAKWAIVEGRSIERFHTFMTGEAFAALRDHTILGRTMRTPDNPDSEAFLRGVSVARGASEAGMLATIFSTRTLGLTGQLDAAQQPDYLSGLLIGHELSGLEKLLEHEGATWTSQPVLLIGETTLVERYRLALAHFGCTHAQTVHNATERGLWQIASQAGLIEPAANAPR